MSSRDSLGTGDLIPQDVVEVFAQKKLTKGGRKKRSNSLGRALGWLKGKKKKVDANGQNLGLGPGLDLALDGHPAGHQGGQKGAQKAGKQAGKQAHPQGNSHGVLKEEDKEKTLVPPLFQENVFIEASRPKYLEDLHTEAQEGLKLMQQEETNSGVEYRDDESSISTVQPEDDGRGFLSDSTTLDTASIVSTQSTISTRSSRSGLTRQGSTFRPLNSGKKPEKVKNRRRSRKTVMGIPQHVQRELGLDRTGWTISQVVDEEQLPNGETIDVPTIVEPHQSADPQEGGSVSPQGIEVLRSTQAGHRDDLALLQCLGSERSATQRPRSLAVPWMTTANSIQQQPPSPVMSMSPQATYLSKIIPNAVMPPSIEVVEISRGQSRSSLRTVSKSSLMLASPASSRASTRASSSRASTLSSASRYNPPHLSDSSCWSHSDSSETLVSNSSTISSNSTTRLGKSQNGDVEDSHEEDKVNVHSSGSKYSKSTSGGKPRTKGDEVKKEAPFVRSLSVMKSKRAPPPPSRSYSLHNKMKRRSRDLAEVRVISRESSPHNTSASGGKIVKNKPGEFKEAGSSPMSSRTTDSHGYTADTSSLDDSTGSVSISPLKSRLSEKEDSIKVEEPVAKDTSPEKHQSPQENGLKKIVSPSSGYSSQDGTPTQPSKRPHTSSPRHKRGILAKLQSLFPGSTHASVVSAPSPLTQPEAPESTKSTETPQPQVNPQLDTVISSPSVRALRELFNIPPPPKVHAPPPPPPEVWAHNKRTFELLLGPPAPNNSYAVVRKNPKDRRQQRPSPSISREGSVKSLSGERKQNSQTPPVESTNGSLHVLETRKVQESEQLNLKFHKESNERLAHVEQHVDVKGKSKVTEKDEKVRVSEIVNGMLVKAIEKHQERLAAIQQEETKIATHTQNSVTEVNAKMDTLSAISLVRASPSPSPPPVHHPPQPPTKQITPLGTPDAASATALQPAISPTSESSWPPPPPPMEQATETLLSGQDEMDFPLPPPPLLSEVELAIPDCVSPVEAPPEQSIHDKTASITTTVRSVQNTECRIQNTECLKVVTEVAPPSEEKPATSSASEGVVSAPQQPPPTPQLAPSLYQGIPPPPLSIPPPPPYTAPGPPEKVDSVAPPVIEVSPPPPAKKVSPPPPAKKVSPPPPAKKVSLPPPTKKFSPPPPAKEVSPPLPAEVVSPPPPAKEVSPPPPAKEVSPPPPAKEVPPPPPAKEVSLPPPAKKVSPPSPADVVSPPPPAKEVSLPRSAKEVSPPPLAEVVSPPPPSEVVSPPPPVKEVSPPPPAKEVSPPPPAEEVSPPPPAEEVSPPPPAEEVSPPPPAKEVSPPPPAEEVSPPPPAKEVSTPPPAKEVSPPPPAKEVSPPPPAKEVSPPPPAKEVSPPPPAKEVSLPPQVKEVTHVLANVVSPLPLVKDVSCPPPVKEISPPPPVQEVSLSSAEDVPPPSQEVTPGSIFPLPKSIPPPPPQEPTPTPLPPQSEPLPSANEINPPPESIPPPPESISLALPLQDVPPNTDGSHPAAQELPPPCPSEIPSPPPLETSTAPQVAQEHAPSPPVNIPLPPPLSVQASAINKHEPSPVTTKNQIKEKISLPALQEESTPIVTPSLLEMVQLRSLNSSPDPTEAQAQAQLEVSMRTKQPSNQVPTASANVEAPQKPIRRSLIMTVPSSTSLPVTSQPDVPKSQVSVAIPTSSSTVLSPTKKSPPAMTTSPSMNLQEAIRLRTAARTKDGLSARLGLQSPTSPLGGDLHKSPSSTASFIFSKSTKKVVIETTPLPETKANFQKNVVAELSSVTKSVNEAESHLKGIKVPPPVAKKPKAKAKEMDSSVETEQMQTAGQEAQPVSINGTPEKTNGTAVSVEGGQTST